MSTSRHQRSESSESNSSTGSSAYQLILDHVLSCPGSYEIPLRTMYTLNSTPRAQPRQGRTSPSSGNGSPTTPQGSFLENQASQTLSENLMAQLSQLPNQPTSLPASFITSFARRCFPPELVQVDFPQALTGLDYLKDLETRRRREVKAAMTRLGVNRDSLDEDSLSSLEPSTAQWIKAIEEKERKIDALYTQLYIGLRRWILINELSLLPFNKHNCVAMLNTLYPPVTTTPPTSRLTASILRNQRDGFFKYIQSVEKSGPRILGTLMQQGKATGDDNGWIAVTRTLGLYLQLANSMINESVEIVDVNSVAPWKERDSKTSSRSSKGTSVESHGANSDLKGAREPRKVDSGVSFNVSEGKPSRSNSIAEPNSPTETARPETARPVTAKRDPVRPKTPADGIKSTATARPRATSASKHGTTLERIARGLKTIGRGRPEVTEIIPEPVPQPAVEKPSSKTLRKMRSLGNIDAHTGSKGDLTSLKPQQFQAGVMTAQKDGVKQSHEV